MDNSRTETEIRRFIDQNVGRWTSAHRCTLQGQSIRKRVPRLWRWGDWTRQCPQIPRRGRARASLETPRWRQEQGENRNNFKNAEPSAGDQTLFQPDSPEMRFLSQGLVSDVVCCEAKPVDANQDMVEGQLFRVSVGRQHRGNLRLR